MFHCFVTMKVLSRLLTIPCNTLELSILKFVTISFEITLPKGTLTLSTFALISNWQIFTKPLDEKVFCRLRGELNIIDASKLESELHLDTCKT